MLARMLGYRAPHAEVAGERAGVASASPEGRPRRPAWAPTPEANAGFVRYQAAQQRRRASDGGRYPSWSEAASFGGRVVVRQLATVGASFACARTITPPLLACSQAWAAATPQQLTSVYPLATWSLAPPQQALFASVASALAAAFGYRLLAQPNDGTAPAWAEWGWRASAALALSPAWQLGMSAAPVWVAAAVGLALADAWLLGRTPHRPAGNVARFVFFAIAFASVPMVHAVAIGQRAGSVVAGACLRAAAVVGGSASIRWRGTLLGFADNADSTLWPLRYRPELRCGAAIAAFADDAEPANDDGLRTALQSLRAQGHAHTAPFRQFLFVDGPGAQNTNALHALASWCREGGTQAHWIPFWQVSESPSPARAVHRLFTAARQRAARTQCQQLLLFDRADPCFAHRNAALVSSPQAARPSADLAEAWMHALSGAQPRANDGLIVAASVSCTQAMDPALLQRLASDVFFVSGPQREDGLVALQRLWTTLHPRYAALAAAAPFNPTAKQWQRWCSAMPSQPNPGTVGRLSEQAVTASLCAANAYFDACDEEALSEQFSQFAGAQFERHWSAGWQRIVAADRAQA